MITFLLETYLKTFTSNIIMLIGICSKETVYNTYMQQGGEVINLSKSWSVDDGRCIQVTHSKTANGTCRALSRGPLF